MTDIEWFTDEDEPREIFRRGDLLHRTAEAWTPAVADLLLHLESVGFDAAPRHRGYDDAGRQVLTFVPGEDGPVSWGHLHSDRGLASVAMLLRRYHDAVRDYRPPGDARWATGSGAPADGELVTHGDFAPWNLTWQDGEATGIFDWDLAQPAAPMSDVYYAMDWTVPFRDDETCREFHHFATVPDRVHRVAVFLEAYGLDGPPADPVAGVVAARRRTRARAAALAAQGVEPQATWVAAGHLESMDSVTRWIEEHADLFRP